VGNIWASIYLHFDPGLNRSHFRELTSLRQAATS
jgi:hypothetical protein